MKHTHTQMSSITGENKINRDRSINEARKI